MLLLLHALIPCLAAYILPSSPVLYTALVSLLFGTVIPTSFNILMEMFYSLLSLVFHCILACKYNALCVCVNPTPFCCSWSCGMHVCNNEEMAFNYAEVLVDSCCSRSRRILGRF